MQKANRSRPGNSAPLKLHVVRGETTNTNTTGRYFHSNDIESPSEQSPYFQSSPESSESDTEENHSSADESGTDPVTQLMDQNEKLRQALRASKKEIQDYNNILKEKRAGEERDRLLTLASIAPSSKALQCSAGVGKIMFKGGVVGFKVAVKTESEIAAKLIPGVSVGVGILMAINRLYEAYTYRTDESYRNQQIGKAVIELISGVAACFPPWGTVAALVMDLGLISHDCYETRPVGFHPLKTDDVEEAYKNLALNKAANPDKAVVDKAFRSISQAIHSDKIQALDLGPVVTKVFDDLQADITKSRDTIYKHKGWH